MKVQESTLLTAMLSRRFALKSIATAAILSSALGPANASAADSHLLFHGREFDEIAAQIDRSIEEGMDLPDALHERFEYVWNVIESTPGTTLEDLQVKARLACWCLLGDLNTPENATGHKRMALSILRDLIRMHRPEMEKPGALAKLVEDIERSVG
jgi:hypothetical protein